MLELIMIIPLLTGIIAMFLPVRLGRGILVVTALLHLEHSVFIWLGKITPSLPQYFTVTNEGLLILLLTSFIFLFISIYAVSYMGETDITHEPIYIGCTLPFWPPCQWWRWPITSSSYGLPLRPPL